MTTEAAKKIGSVLGEVFAPMNPKLFDGGHFIRIQVSIDLSLPLCCGRLVSVGEGGKQLWISFKYERLPNMMIEIVTCGLIARALSNQNNMSLDHI